ncbi:MAG: GTPase [Blastocatellia bacterium]
MAGLEIGTTEAVTKAAIEIISKAHKQGWFDKLVSALRKKHRVVVLGATGIGKTAFLESLTETLPRAIESMNRTVFNEKRRIKISKDLFIFTDTPGHRMYTKRRLEAIKEVLKMEGGVEGIINVVSYGYHEASSVRLPAIGASAKAP